MDKSTTHLWWVISHLMCCEFMSLSVNHLGKSQRLLPFYMEALFPSPIVAKTPWTLSLLLTRSSLSRPGPATQLLSSVNTILTSCCLVFSMVSVLREILNEFC